MKNIATKTAVLFLCFLGIWLTSGVSPGRETDKEHATVVVEFVGLDAANGVTREDYLEVSDPRPEILLDEITCDDIVVSGHVATVYLSGTVTDAFTDNIAPHCADNVYVRFFVNGVPAGSSPVERVDAGPPSFWRQYPYKGRFVRGRISFDPMHYQHTLRVETTTNVAGFKGFTELHVDFAEKYPPVGQSENIYFVREPSAGRRDRLKYFFGERHPEEDDTTFVETAPASLMFRGSMYHDCEKSPASLIAVAFLSLHWFCDNTTDTLMITNFRGLTDNVDTLTAVLTSMWPEEPEHATVETNTFIETSRDSRLFRVTFTNPPQEIVASLVAQRLRTSGGRYEPFLVRARGAIDMNRHLLAVNGFAFEMVQVGDWFYPRGDGKSVTAFAMTRNPSDSTSCRFLFYDQPHHEIRSTTCTIGEELVAQVVPKGGEQSHVAQATASSWLISMDTDLNWDLKVDDEDYALKTGEPGVRIFAPSSSRNLTEFVVTVLGGEGVGAVWLEFDAEKFGVWEDRAGTRKISPGTKENPNWNLDRGERVPDRIYIEPLPGARDKAGGITINRTF